MKFEFSDREVAVLKTLINLAVKAGGLQVAEAAVVLNRRLDSPLTDSKEVQDETVNNNPK